MTVEYLEGPKISVIIPVYNVEAYLPDCIDSVLRQEMREIEIICVDDGSADESLNVLKGYSEKYNNIKVLSQVNRGPSSARNAGLEIAAGQYIYFLDSDDMLAENALSALYETAENKKLDVLYFDGSTDYKTDDLRRRFSAYQTIYGRKYGYGFRERGIDLLADMIPNEDYSVSVCLQLIRREFLTKAGVTFFPGILHEDNLFSFQCILTAGRCAHTKNQYFIRKIRENSIVTTKKTFENFYGLYIVYREMIKFVEKNPLTVRERRHEEAVCSVIENVLRTLCDIYRYNLEEEEKIKLQLLAPMERFQVKKLLERAPMFYLIPYRLLPPGCRVVLYGAGNNGKKYYRQLMSDGYVNIVSWIDKSFIKLKKEGFPVKAVETIKDQEYDFVFISVEDPDKAADIIKNLILLGVALKKIVWSGELMNKNSEQNNSYYGI